MDATRTAVEALAPRYDEPWRSYHTREHVEEMLTALRSLVGEELPPALELAAWAHDAVYHPHASAGDNERASAALARAVLTECGVPADVVGEVVDLTLATITHDTADETDPGRRSRAAAFLDADLWILAAPPQRFDEYERQVRREYSFVPDEVFRAARAGILAGFAERPWIYLTERARQDWEVSARSNLARRGHQGSVPQRSSS